MRISVFCFKHSRVTASSLHVVPCTVLRLDPHDRDALQTKLFLLLQTDQYAAALAMTQAPVGLPSESEDEGSDRAFERAYSLYRLHREVEATAVVDGLKTGGGEEESDRGVLHLEAQLVRGAPPAP